MQNIKTLILLSLALICTLASGQNRCDTLITKDGKQILIKQIHTRTNGIAYSKCAEINGPEYFLTKSQVQEIRFQAPDTTLSNLDTDQLSSYTGNKKTYSDLSRPTYTLWAGASFPDIAQVDYRGEDFSWFQFGLQIGFKDKPIFLTMMYHPSRYRVPYFEDIKIDGINGDLTFSIKKASLGRVSGRVSRAYIGADLQVGRRSYSYASNFSLMPSRIEIGRLWYTILVRPGIQSSLNWFTFDLALPLGLQTTQYTFFNGSNSGSGTERNFSICPTASVGVRF